MIEGVSRVGVVGASTMGAGIAQTFAAAGYPVLLRDIGEAPLGRGMGAIKKSLERLVGRGKLTAQDRDGTLERIAPTTKIKDLADCDVVVEAVLERFDLKKTVMGELDNVCRAGAILATNTSSISVTHIASTSKIPGRVIGMHFFNPVPMMALIEIIRALQTTDETCNKIVALTGAIGKKARVSKNFYGFVVNRVLIPMINEAVNCVYEGLASPEDVDQMMKLGANHPMGPLSLADLIGLDIVLDIMETLYNGFDNSKYRPSPLLKQMCDAGYLGRKTGKGFFPYEVAASRNQRHFENGRSAPNALGKIPAPEAEARFAISRRQHYRVCRKMENAPRGCAIGCVRDPERVMSDHTVVAFDRELDELGRRIAEMGDVASRMVSDAVNALSNGDSGLAQSVLERDPRLDALQREVEDKAILAIARRQPVARHLREVLGAARIAGDFERVGDLAKNIAWRATMFESETRPTHTTVRLRRMSDLASDMLIDVLDAYARRDAMRAEIVWLRDAELNSMEDFDLSRSPDTNDGKSAQHHGLHALALLLEEHRGNRQSRGQHRGQRPLRGHWERHGRSPARATVRRDRSSTSADF